MKLASFVADGRERFGLVSSGGLVDLFERGVASDLKAALAAGTPGLERFADAVPDWSIDDVTWLPPVPHPTHIIGVGLNTRSHFEETSELMNRKGGDYPRYPRLFHRSPLSQVGHGQPLVVPEVSEHLDYEGEIAVVIGRAGRNVPVDRAGGHIAGYACYNDGSVRDFQRHSSQVTAGKNFVASGAFGPWIVTKDEVGDPDTLTLETRVNGEVRQRLLMSDLIFDFAHLIAYVSQIYELQPGDTILTGSPAGIGALSGTWLKEGDLVEIEIPAVGVLSNPVTCVREQADGGRG